MKTTCSDMAGHTTKLNWLSGQLCLSSAIRLAKSKWEGETAAREREANWLDSLAGKEERRHESAWSFWDFMASCICFVSSSPRFEKKFFFRRLLHPSLSFKTIISLIYFSCLGAGPCCCLLIRQDICEYGPERMMTRDRCKALESSVRRRLSIVASRRAILLLNNIIFGEAKWE